MAQERGRRPAFPRALFDIRGCYVDNSGAPSRAETPACIAHAPVLPAGREGLLAQLGRLFYELFIVSISRRKNDHQPMIVPLTGFARPDHAG
jgi:hypothetical protein